MTSARATPFTNEMGAVVTASVFTSKGTAESVFPIAYTRWPLNA